MSASPDSAAFTLVNERNTSSTTADSCITAGNPPRSIQSHKNSGMHSHRLPTMHLESSTCVTGKIVSSENTPSICFSSSPSIASSSTPVKPGSLSLAASPAHPSAPPPQPLGLRHVLSGPKQLGPTPDQDHPSRSDRQHCLFFPAATTSTATSVSLRPHVRRRRLSFVYAAICLSACSILLFFLSLKFVARASDEWFMFGVVTVAKIYFPCFFPSAPGSYTNIPRTYMVPINSWLRL